MGVLVGLIMNLGVNEWAYTGAYEFSAEVINLGTYVPFAPEFTNMKFIEDPLNTTTDGKHFYPNMFGAECMPGNNLFGDLQHEAGGHEVASGACIYQATKYPEEMKMKPTVIAIVALPYDPCDKEGDAVFIRATQGLLNTRWRR